MKKVLAFLALLIAVIFTVASSSILMTIIFAFITIGIEVFIIYNH